MSQSPYADRSPAPATQLEVLMPPIVPPVFDVSKIFQQSFFAPTDAKPASPADLAKEAAQQAESANQTLLWMNIDSMLDHMPPGTVVDHSQFAARFGAETAAHLDKAGLTKITDTAKPGQQPHFELDFNNAGTIDTKNGVLIHGDKVDFDYSKSATGEVDLGNVHGLTCKGKHGIKSLSTATVDDVKILHESNGNVRLTGLAHWGFLHGTGIYEFGPDGKQIEQPPKPGA